MLNDAQIEFASMCNGNEGNLIIPFSREFVNPHSYDLRLGTNFKIATSYNSHTPKEERFLNVDIADNETFTIRPLQFILAHTVEVVNVPTWLTGFAQGKSTIARNGLQIEAAGLCDAGFCGQVTLELFNMSPWPLVLTPGMRICQITFTKSDPAQFGDYKVKGHYQEQKGAKLPCYYL